MRFYFLGTSHGYPEANKRCSCTLLEIGDQYYFLDMGIMAIEDLINKGIPVDAVKGMFISHPHGDHINGLVGFADHCSWLYKTADPIVYLPKIESAHLINQWIQLTLSRWRSLRYVQIEPGVIFDDGVLKVTAIPTQHCEKSYAFLLEAEGKTILFTGDLKNPGVDFPEIAKERELDLLICENAHFLATDYEPVLAQCRVKKICIHHYMTKRIPSILEFIQHMDPVPVTMMGDGMEVTV